MRNTLTQQLRVLESQAATGARAPERWEFGGGRYVLRVANDLQSRRKAYGLVYRLYLEKEYARPHPSRMWLSIFDALPETVTLLVERTDTGAAVGALTVVFDSPIGLPADGLYKPELDALRAVGRRLSEIVSLGVDEGAGGGSEILVKLFNCVFLVARKVRGATDFMITVNPRHLKFYERTLLFRESGPERNYRKVGGAPALLLRLDLAVPEEQVRLEHGPEEACPPRSRTLYRTFRPPDEDSATTAGLRSSLRPMSEEEIGCFLVSETDVLAEATPEQRAYLQERFLAYELDTLQSVSA